MTTESFSQFIRTINIVYSFFMKPIHCPKSHVIIIQPATIIIMWNLTYYTEHEVAHYLCVGNEALHKELHTVNKLTKPTHLTDLTC